MTVFDFRSSLDMDFSLRIGFIKSVMISSVHNCCLPNFISTVLQYFNLLILDVPWYFEVRTILKL